MNPPEPYEEVFRVSEEYGVDEQTAEEILELVDELGIDEDDAVEIISSL